MRLRYRAYLAATFLLGLFDVHMALSNMAGTSQALLTGAGQAPTLTFTGNVTQTGGSGGIATGRSYPNVPISADLPGRIIIVLDGFRDNGNCPLASLTVNGISATRVAQQINTSTNTTITSMWVVAGVTSTLANIVTTYCGNVDSAEGLGVYAAYNLSSPVPTQTAGSNSSTAPSLNLNVSPDGFVIAAAWALGQSGTMCSWTGVTGDYNMITDPTSTSQIMAGASASGLTAASPRTVSCTYGATSSGEASALAASFR